MKRRTNGAALRYWARENGSLALTRLSLEAKVSMSLLQKIKTDIYESAPKADTREAICKATGLKMDFLFPLVSASEEEAS